MTFNQDFIQEIIETCVCPSCHAEMLQRNNHLFCQNCNQEYQLIAGIPDFLHENGVNDKIHELSTIYDNKSEKHNLSPKSCGYGSDTAHLSRLNILKKWLDYGQTREKRVLDVGCGIGLMTQQLTDANHVWGVDVSIGLLQLARAKGIRALAASADLLPFEDGSFDIVLCVGVIPYYEKPDKIFSEIRRVIKPGGRIVITSTTDSLLIKTVRCLKTLFGGTSQLVRLYSSKEIAEAVVSVGCDVLDSCVAYGNIILPAIDGQIGLRFRIFSRVAAVLATVPK